MPNKQFENVPIINAPRSKFDLSHGNTISMNVGYLYPVYYEEIYPGDEFHCEANFVSRLVSSYLRPVMDTLYMDIHFFFVPNRLVFEDFPCVLGENKTGPYAIQEEVTVPAIPTTDDDNNVATTIYEGTVADYMDMCPGYYAGEASLLKFRAFAAIWNEWFRDENYDQPMYIHKGAADPSEALNNNTWSPSNYTGKLPHVNKFKDVFTSALPSTQKGTTAGVSLTSGIAPLKANGGIMTALGGSMMFGGNTIRSSNSNLLAQSNITADGSYDKIFSVPNASTAFSSESAITSTNLVADLSNAGIMSIPDIRNAFQLQRILEREARGGSRYREYILQAFGVQTPDARLQIPEYLGGKRIPLQVQQVAQTTRTESESTQLGSLGAFSLSNGRAGYVKGFCEHGYVLGVACLRNYHRYAQGINKHFQRIRRWDFYDPALQAISEVPVYKSEIFSSTVEDSKLKDKIWGYQEAWYDLRSHPNRVAGNMRPTATNSLDIYTFVDDYANRPTMNSAFLKEVPDFVDRTIAVPSTSGQDQFAIDWWFDQSAVRCLPPYSVPGFIDHH